MKSADGGNPKTGLSTVKTRDPKTDSYHGSRLGSESEVQVIRIQGSGHRVRKNKEQNQAHTESRWRLYH